MEAYLLDWANLLVRWLHLTAGIAWIGTSFYYIALDYHLLPAVRGDLLVRTAVHRSRQQHAMPV